MKLNLIFIFFIMATLSGNSPILEIINNTVPTPSTLPKGSLAYGIFDEKLRYFGNTGSVIIEFTSQEYTALTSDEITINANGEISIIAEGVTVEELASALQIKINNVMDVANGRTKAIVFDTETQMNQWLTGDYAHPSELTKDDLNRGDLLFCRALNVSDYWWSGNVALELKSSMDLSDYLEEIQTKALIDTKISEITVKMITQKI